MAYITACFWTLTLLTFFSFSAFADEFTGVVIGVHDGDTVTVLTSDRARVKVRLAEIDAPELDQPYGKHSKKILSEMVFEKSVKIMWEEKDRYKRTIGKIYVDDKYINADLIKLGGAWVYRRYSHSPDLLQMETSAKNDHIGLWSLQADQIIPPWEWRQGNK